MKTTKISDLKPDKRNANKGTKKGRQLLNNSIRELKAGRSVLVDKNGVIIAGNKTVEQATDAGIKDVIIVETTGDQLVAVKRTDLDLETDEKARRLAYADNRVSELDLEWDADAIKLDLDDGIDLGSFFDDDSLHEMGINLDDVVFKELDEDIVDDVEFHECPECGHKWAK